MKDLAAWFSDIPRQVGPRYHYWYMYVDAACCETARETSAVDLWEAAAGRIEWTIEVDDYTTPGIIFCPWCGEKLPLPEDLKATYEILTRRPPTADPRPTSPGDASAAGWHPVAPASLPPRGSSNSAPS